MLTASVAVVVAKLGLAPMLRYAEGMKIFTLFLLLFTLLSVAEARNVYRWVAADGTVTFADRPLSREAEVYEPQQRTPVAIEEQGDPVAERKKRKCIEARDRLEQYSSQSEIRRVDKESGRIVRLEPEAREALITEARQDAQVWCDDEAVVAR